MKQLARNHKELDSIVLLSELTNTKDVSFEHFKDSIITHLESANDAYYNGNGIAVDDKLNEVIKLAVLAKEFNKHFGL